MAPEKPVTDVEFSDPMRTAYLQIAESVAAGEETLENVENTDGRHVPADPDQLVRVESGVRAADFQFPSVKIGRRGLKRPGFEIDPKLKI